MECYPGASMRLKVDQSLNIGYAKETVPRNTLGQQTAIVNEELTNTAARVTPMKSAPNVFPRSRCGRRSCVEEDIVDRDNFINLGELYIILC